jgi:hypothetical protein
VKTAVLPTKVPVHKFTKMAFYQTARVLNQESTKVHVNIGDGWLYYRLQIAKTTNLHVFEGNNLLNFTYVIHENYQRARYLVSFLGMDMVLSGIGGGELYRLKPLFLSSIKCACGYCSLAVFKVLRNTCLNFHIWP